MIDTRQVNPYVHAHQNADGRWILHDFYKDTTSREAYATFAEARRAYATGETTWE